MLHYFSIFFFNDTATTEIYTLSLHDALPISAIRLGPTGRSPASPARVTLLGWGCPREKDERHAADIDMHTGGAGARRGRSEEHTSELQSRQYLVCRLLLEKKKKCS